MMPNPKTRTSNAGSTPLIPQETLQETPVSDYILTHRTLLHQNLTSQKRFLNSLIAGKETQLRLLGDMNVVREVLNQDEQTEVEIRALRRRLELVDQKIGKLEGRQVESIGKEIERAKRGMGDGRGSSSSVSSGSSSEGEEGTWGWI